LKKLTSRRTGVNSPVKKGGAIKRKKEDAGEGRSESSLRGDIF